MPPERQCPSCKEVVPDWHFEWHAGDDQKAIYEGKLAMTCPFCGAGVTYDGFDLGPASPKLRKAQRDITKASCWARMNGGGSLAKYLQTEIGQPYVGLWSRRKVQAADKSEAKKQDQD